MKKLSSFSNIEPKTLGKRQNFTLRSINCILRDQRSFIGNFSCALSNFFIYFGLLAKTIRSVCQNCFRWALRIVLKKRFSSKKYFACFSHLDQTFLGLLAKKLVGWQNCRWKSPGEHFENKVFFEKKILFFQTLRQKRSENGKNFRLRSLNCIIRDQKNILRNFFLRFGDPFCHFRTFIKNNSERLSKLLSMSPEDRFGKEKIFLRHRGFIHDFWTYSQQF